MGAPSDSYGGGMFHTSSAANMSRRLKAQKRLQRGEISLPGIRRAKPKKPLATPRLDEFAELLANGTSVGDAAVAMGLPREKGHTLLHRLRKRLGPQAT